MRHTFAAITGRICYLNLDGIRFELRNVRETLPEDLRPMSVPRVEELDPLVRIALQYWEGLLYKPQRLLFKNGKPCACSNGYDAHLDSLAISHSLVPLTQVRGIVG